MAENGEFEKIWEEIILHEVKIGGMATNNVTLATKIFFRQKIDKIVAQEIL